MLSAEKLFLHVGGGGLHTINTLIIVVAGIIAVGGKVSEFNYRRRWNNRSGWKILTDISNSSINMCAV